MTHSLAAARFRWKPRLGLESYASDSEPGSRAHQQGDDRDSASFRWWAPSRSYSCPMRKQSKMIQTGHGAKGWQKMSAAMALGF